MLSCFRVPLLNLDNWPCVLGHIMKVILPRYKYYKNKKKSSRLYERYRCIILTLLCLDNCDGPSRLKAFRDQSAWQIIIDIY